MMKCPAKSSLIISFGILLGQGNVPLLMLSQSSFLFYVRNTLCLYFSCSHCNKEKTHTSFVRYPVRQPPVSTPGFPAFVLLRTRSWSLQRWSSQKQSQLSDSPKPRKTFSMLFSFRLLEKPLMSCSF